MNIFDNDREGSVQFGLPKASCTFSMVRTIGFGFNRSVQLDGPRLEPKNPLECYNRFSVESQILQASNQ